MTFEEWFFQQYGGPPILREPDSIDVQLFEAWNAGQAAQKRKDAEIVRGLTAGGCDCTGCLGLRRAAKAIEEQEEV